MLHMANLEPVLGYSKGSRGLSVLVRVCGIFTTATISPSPSWRQYSCRYAIRAGRNLPDKEFRYLRTVIGASAPSLALRLTSHLNVPTAGKRQSLYVVFDDFAETCVFSKQSQLSFSCGLPFGRHPLSLTYGVNLPSSFT